MDYVSSTIAHASCPHCGFGHTGVCPRVKAIEYNPDGTVRRVEFHQPKVVATGDPNAPLAYMK